MHQAVQVYFLLADASYQQTTVIENNNTIVVPGAETLIPGVLKKTVLAMRTLLADPRRKFMYILRTNMSSMWQWHRLLAVLKHKPVEHFLAGYLFSMQEFPGITMISGAGFIMSRDVCDLLISHEGMLNYTLIDDVAISLLMLKLRVKPTPLQRCDFVNNQLPSPVDDGVCYHWRIKNPDRLHYDGYLFSRLYFEAYPLDASLHLHKPAVGDTHMGHLR